MTDPAPENDPIHIAAAEWFVRVQERDLPLETALEWQRWMSADVRHAKAFVRIEEVWEESWETLGRTAKKSRRAPALAWAASISAVAVAISWILLSDLPLPWSSGASETIQTAVAENRTVQLSDGSQVTLGGGTEIRVALDDDERRIELRRGEAFFTVAKDLSRPFVVGAGEATVTALGTQFNVRLSLGRTTVAVVEGRVKVASAPVPAPIAWIGKAPQNGAPLKLDAGQQAIVDEGGVSSALAFANGASAIAWQTGQLAFRGEPLRYVLEDVNRYAAKPIVIEDSPENESIGDIQITGTVLRDSVAGWIDSLESAFGLQAREEPRRIVLSMHRGFQ